MHLFDKVETNQYIDTLKNATAFSILIFSR